MMSVPVPAAPTAPAVAFGFCACTSAAQPSTATPRVMASLFIIYLLAGPPPRSLMPGSQPSNRVASWHARRRRSRENEIDLAPILLRGRALRGPVRRVIQLVRHLCRPVAADVAVEK